MLNQGRNSIIHSNMIHICLIVLTFVEPVLSRKGYVINGNDADMNGVDANAGVWFRWQ